MTVKSSPNSFQPTTLSSEEDTYLPEEGLGPPSPHLRRWKFRQRFFYRFAEMLVPRLFRRLFNAEVNGLEYLQMFQEGTPVIFCGNHRSHLDALLAGTAIAPPTGYRRFGAFMVNGKSMNENVLFKQMKYLGGFPVFREDPEPALQYSIETLRAGIALIVFPQGGRVSRSSPLSDYHNLAQEGKTGIGRIVLRLNGQVPVVPFYIHGSAEALPPGSFLPRFGSHVSITFGKPLSFNRFYRSGGWNQDTPEFFDTAREIVNLIMQNIWDLLCQVESDFLEFLQTKLGISLEDREGLEEKEGQLKQILSKLMSIKPSEIRDFLYKRQ